MCNWVILLTAGINRKLQINSTSIKMFKIMFSEIEFYPQPAGLKVVKIIQLDLTFYFWCLNIYWFFLKDISEAWETSELGYLLAIAF